MVVWNNYKVQVLWQTLMILIILLIWIIVIENNLGIHFKLIKYKCNKQELNLHIKGIVELYE